MSDTKELEVEIEETLFYNKEELAEQVKCALKLATDNALASVNSDGHWCGELKSAVTNTAEYIFLRQAIGLDLKADGDAYSRWILSQQNKDGSWGLAPEIPGDVSVTTEAYLALKILGINPNSAVMRRARMFVLQSGGVAKVRNFTRMFLATFGLFPWDSTSQLPVELILLPASCPINIYKLASWARATFVPLAIISHHQPIYALPNGRHRDNDYLDELWQVPTRKNVPCGESLFQLAFRGELTSLAFGMADKVLYYLNGLRSVPYLRAHARKKCMEWILERQESTGDWGGIFPPMHGSIFAFLLEGYVMDDAPVRLGIQALENFAWEDENGKRIQACVSPTWDTAFMSIALCDAMSGENEAISKAISWIQDRQQVEPRGDWTVYRPELTPGGYAFEYENSWYPDVDDTAVVILAQVKHDPRSILSKSVIEAATWIIGMQNHDGGWAAFDVGNDKLFLNKIPFNDLNAVCDTSCADITGHILEAFGLMMRRVPEKGPANLLFPALRAASLRGIDYLAGTQEPNGAWLGRWGCNYIYGTSHALCGLGYFRNEDTRVCIMSDAAVKWLKSTQNPDGGWGESLLSYASSDFAPMKSTPTQTGWALMGLLAHISCDDATIVSGIRYLVSSQTRETSVGPPWDQTAYTAVGFPNHFYLEYDYYRHYFPMMALGRYLQEARVNK
ncbi:hypothetical protein N7456_001155 [Penicillium angulare]|uniref:Terpene cyclase/mutase family member n=1 Tax=Penicillium angulare TaxID=116970 RepID=A0A9W9KRL2_9EURO|nr:hypothetical protein N7456_001155 [Penicillium angulare]